MSQTFLSWTTVLVTIKTAKESLIATAEHPFYIENVGFVEAEDVTIGDPLRLASGEVAVVESVEKEIQEELEPMYKLEIEELHTYYVGTEGVLVHNTCGNGSKGNGSANKTSKSFWKSFDKLPQDIQKQARDAFELFKKNPNHPGLNFEQLSGGKYYSVRINKKYRAYGRKLSNGSIEWIEINGHDYNKAIKMVESKK